MKRKEILQLALLIAIIAFAAWRYMTRTYETKRSEILLDTFVEVSIRTKDKTPDALIDSTFSLMRGVRGSAVVLQGRQRDRADQPLRYDAIRDYGRCAVDAGDGKGPVCQDGFVVRPFHRRAERSMGLRQRDCSRFRRDPGGTAPCRIRQAGDIGFGADQAGGIQDQSGQRRQRIHHRPRGGVFCDRRAFCRAISMPAAISAISATPVRCGSVSVTRVIGRT